MARHGKTDLVGEVTFPKSLGVHPWSLTLSLKINPWKRRFLSNTIMFRFPC